MTNFTLAEFNEVFAVVESAFNAQWVYGRERKSKTTLKDALFMALTVLKHFGTCQKHAADFKMKAPTFEKNIYKAFEIISPVLRALRASCLNV
jgi:hypothetical protein